MRPKVNTPAFSLVEVVIALGIISFALIAVIGLVTVGSETNRESSGQIQAANTASLLMATARALPTNPPSSFALPNLSQTSVTNTVQIGIDGTVNSAQAAYNLYYIVGTNIVTGPKLANVYLCLWWPLSAQMPTNNPGAYYEVAAQIALP
jgi:type II secretory pathway pseudopilin PulG